MGHEIVDVVIQAGHKVKDLQVGDHVSIGALVSACLNKDPKAPDKYKSDGAITYGGYADYMRVPHEFVIKIPDSIHRAWPCL
ncbi:hypothetical protein PR001_g29768 [Phytophthora rubi]|uniref:Alcohol dehydrogenase-like N-terminal domain-containing protein n=1 Tax=Phytophthora rubi TaxID=129364 RepID=A0A6A3GZV6_9STRA|nr:hypothetical protein PR001_g29768 [Phytophthora rubi]